MPTVSFKTLGCRLNQAETATMSGAFLSAGYEIVPFNQDADVCVIHSCTITLRAESECNRIARKLKRRTPPPLVVLAGCAVETLPAQATQEHPADLLVDQKQKSQIVALVANALGHPTLSCCSTTAATPDFATTRALVKVQDGCSFFCSYCIVPYTRGLPASRDFDEIIREIAALAAQGYEEIGLTGANIGCYDDHGRTLLDLLRAAEATSGVKRLRIGSIEPTTIEREVIDFMADSRVLAPYLHLALQSGDDHILKQMRRRYTVQHYRDIVSYAQERLPLFGLGTDIITGFPGETDDLFANTRALVEELPFTNLHVFPYSERPGTKAEQLPGAVPVNLRRSRANELIAIGDAKKQQFAARQLGQSVEILIERVDASGTGRGWTAEYIETRIPDLASSDVGSLLKACVTEAHPDGSLTAVT